MRRVLLMSEFFKSRRPERSVIRRTLSVALVLAMCFSVRAMASDEKALLAAIEAHPGEDTPRLAYADWLDEHAQPERAEFIRTEIELFRGGAALATDRKHGLERRRTELLDKNRRTWLPEALFNPRGRPLVDVVWERGFPSMIRFKTGYVSPAADRLLAGMNELRTVTKLILDTVDEPTLRKLTVLPRITSVQVAAGNLPAFLEVQDAFPGVRSLKVDRPLLRTRLEELVASPIARRLESLELDSFFIPTQEDRSAAAFNSMLSVLTESTLPLAISR